MVTEAGPGKKRCVTLICTLLLTISAGLFVFKMDSIFNYLDADGEGSCQGLAHGGHLNGTDPLLLICGILQCFFKITQIVELLASS